MTTLIPPLAFWAIDRNDAEAQALRWAHHERRIVSAKVTHSQPAPVRPHIAETRGAGDGVHQERQWWVELEVEWDREPEQGDLGLVTTPTRGDACRSCDGLGTIRQRGRPGWERVPCPTCGGSGTSTPRMVAFGVPA